MNDGGKAIRGLLQGGQGMSGAYAGAGQPAGHRPWYMHPETVFGLSPEEKSELQSLGVDLSGMGMIPIGDVNDYRSAKALGGRDFEMWKQTKQNGIRQRLLQNYQGPNSRFPGAPDQGGMGGRR